MKRSSRALAVLALVVGLVGPAVPAAADGGDYQVLVFSRTTGYRHASIPVGIAAIKELGAENGFGVDTTEDDTQFTDANLAKYDAVIFLSTTGDPVTRPESKAAFQRYIEAGGGYLGIHAASDSGYNWSWYGGLVGAYFRDHPAIQPALVRVVGQGTEATRGLPSKWWRTDEWYNFRTNPRGEVRVLARIDESTYNPVGYTGGSMGEDHPMAWCHNYDGGRAVYTALGHTDASYSEPFFLTHLLGSIRMAAGQAKFNCEPNE
ncbi:ThuA domain-containing protein [Micromonospora mirobrigensis]|uniref:Type 1 glutamine amidotransferase (GATase1) n=1 Tax=Micromonospora mirobrigensis TaxID=262898 RepID=A0A1C4WA06_9ACTN|nr:ThuA domain-containing protein [Micromonospora mirobrigensis]SCE92801.1 Type 1 glutamine amidotransferase (GATase1) [Micromonospora mirobrigensis]